MLAAAIAAGCAGCSSGSGQILMPYTNAKEDIDPAAMIPADRADGFSSDLAVVSVDQAASADTKKKLSDIDATEIFLTGTDDGKVLAASEIYKTMPPASLTKILTALIALKSGTDLDKEYTLGDDISVSVADAQVCGFKAGDVITLRTLLYCMLIYSGNDAANAVASVVSGGDIPSFCKKMNQEASRLGATQTNFVTPNGLDEADHYSSAYDLYLIFRECLGYDLFRDAISQKGYTAHFKRDGKEITQYYASTNHYKTGEAQPPKGVTVVGGKTGTTDKAGLCLILYAQDDSGKGYISVLLGSPDKSTLYESMTNLLSNIGK